MRKISLFLLGALISVALAPLALGDTAPLYIKSAEVYTKTANQGIAGEVTVCSSYHGETKFEVWAKNATVTAQYKRKLVMESGCEKFKLNFTPTFSNVSKQGDKIVIDLRKVETEESQIPTKVDSYTTTIKNSKEDALPCGDKIGGDDDYKACVGDFITHRYTNVRVKVTNFDNEKIKLIVTGIQWGGSVELTIYKDKAKKVIAGDDDLTRVKLAYKGKDEKGNAILGIDAL